MRVIILAGGQGTRLWPLSLENLPKQFLKLGNRHSLFQQTLLRFSSYEILIVTLEQYKELIEKDLKEIGMEQFCDILTEPCSRNTAPALTLAITYLQEEKKVPLSEKVLITPSDHFFSPNHFFSKDLPELSEKADNSSILLFGVYPSYPHTGYGYIEMGEKKAGFLEVKQFREKPSLSKAKEYLLSGSYLWNMGMVHMTVESFWNHLRENAPDIHSIGSKGLEYCKNQYEKFPNVSIDYALLEKIEKMYVYPLHLGWSDVGSWDNLYQVMEKDKEKNVKKGNVITLDTQNSFILAGQKLVTTLGVKDLIVVDTEKAIFIARKGASQRVKELFRKMRDLSKEEKPKTNKKPLPEYTK